MKYIEEKYFPYYLSLLFSLISNDFRFDGNDACYRLIGVVLRRKENFLDDFGK